jgi:hypothetical protein
MKKKSGVFFIVFLTGILIGAVKPAGLYAGGLVAEPEPWVRFIDTSSFTGTQLSGTLSIVYNPNKLASDCGRNVATMFYTVRFHYSQKIYSSEGATEGISLGDYQGQWNAIQPFLGRVIEKILPNSKDWKLKSVKNAIISSNNSSFVADITVMVKE